MSTYVGENAYGGPSLFHFVHQSRVAQSNPELSSVASLSLASLLWTFRLYFLSLELQGGLPPPPAIYMDSGNPHLGLHIFVARVLTTESSPQLQNVSSKMQRHTATHVNTHTGGPIGLQYRVSSTLRDVAQEFQQGCHRVGLGFF